MRIVFLAIAAALLSACASVETPMAKPEWTLLIHGGAGVMRRAEMTPGMDAAYRAGLNDALEAGSKVLAGGGLAVDAVEAAVRVLEDNPSFNAGKGAVLTREGVAELDASIMDGRDRNAGAVAQVRTVKNPIRAARLVMETTGRVMFAGKEVDAMAAKAGLEIVPPEYFITPRRLDALKRAIAGDWQPMDRHGTVGAVAMDKAGNLAAATSTGGMNAKPPGRVGDSPIIGAGTYADNASCAVSATGDGEHFIRASVARMICARVQMQGMSAEQAASATLDEVAALGGTGGVIVLSHDGSAALRMNTEGMFRGRADATGFRRMGIYADE
ncbi:MAG: isoaspartyl peptidase/L-asparaginase [Hyphomonadaceae bacterium]|nr:isoaspartyl peptidase/L-asparaginase [Hyphomonadaceae bacterium]